MNGSEGIRTLRHFGIWPVLIYILLVVLAIATGRWRQTVPLLEAWLFGFLVLAGLSSASLGLLMIAHLLGEAWLRPVRGQLEAAASTLPLVAVLAIPLAAGLDQLYPWADGQTGDLPTLRQLYFSEPYVLARSAVILPLWIAIAALVIRRGEHPWVSAIGLALMALSSAISTIDWVVSREPAWWSGGFAFAYTVTQLTGAMALAQLVAMLQRDYPEPRRYHNLQRAAITLALLTLWVWFAQFLIVWMADLPNEAGWFLVRAHGWLWLKLGIIVPTLIAAIAILLISSPGRRRLAFACALLLIQYIGQMIWLVRPASPSLAALTWTDLVVWALLGLLWGTWFAAMLHRPQAQASGATRAASA